MTDIHFIQFRYSPYNEKVRWALDLSGLPHHRQSVMPGPHMGLVRKLTGQTKTPTLKLNGQWVAGFARIIAALEDHCPALNLTPAEPDLRARALEIQAKFDDIWGPLVRQAVLHVMLGDLAYFARLFGEGQPALKRIGYRGALPLAKPLIRKGNNLTHPGAFEEGRQTAKEALDWVVAETVATGYLVRDRFTIADLTTASMLAAVANPPNSPATRPEPKPAAVTAWQEGWHDHPGAVWTRRIYAEHRVATTDILRGNRGTNRRKCHLTSLNQNFNRFSRKSWRARKDSTPFSLKTAEMPHSSHF